ncbi:hypothetical protein [Mycoplasma todarodis]|uniref:Uncharacterized protein n=1 Tax=Mycoplasma todarodis TaxID=1937191 RepID=A0A4V2NI35_9MOLU|nr:hypothetical protein [Mycoplasma todarodis]TCG11308.1 hypothetical protein C4B25_01845 [Mycoplasma todarodis]
MKNIFKSMSRKSLIIGSTVLVGAAAFTIAIPVAISQRDDSNPDYEVTLANANGARYFATKINPQQMVPELTSKSYWDFINSDDNVQDAIAKSEGTLKEFITGSISKGKVFENGLEKLFYDLINAKNNGPVITLKFGTKMETTDKNGKTTLVDATVSIKDFTKLDENARKAELKRLATTKTEALYNALHSVLMTHGKAVPTNTSLQDITNALATVGIK